MFKRIYAVLMAAILTVTVLVTAVCLSTLRNSRINQRQAELIRTGRQIAWVAAQSSSDITNILTRRTDSDTQRYLSRLASDVYDEFGAYILVVNRAGRVMDNMNALERSDPDFVASLSSRDISQAMAQVLTGEEITLRTTVGGEAKFTIGLPFMRDGRVLGAVFIQTPAQSLERGLRDLLWRVLIVAGGVILLSGAAAFPFVRGVTRPLRRLSEAAGQMADGDFSVRSDVTTPIPEVRELGRSFDTMADKLDRTEQNRREFVANVSHELRSPITGIQGFVEGMTDGTIPPEEHGKYLHIVLDETRRLSRLIGDLLALSRLERDDARLTIVSFDMCELLRQAVIRRMKDIEGKQLRLKCEFDADTMPVMADPDRIDQVVANLLDNAIKFTPSDGTVTLRCREAGPDVAVTVCDDGIGILPEDRPKVFDRFFTADRAHTSGSGTGLGLSICQRIMNMHGRTITIDDTVEGASFTFTLPAGKEA